MNVARNQLLAGAGFAIDQYGGFAWRYTFDVIENCLRYWVAKNQSFGSYRQGLGVAAVKLEYGGPLLRCDHVTPRVNLCANSTRHPSGSLITYIAKDMRLKKKPRQRAGQAEGRRYR